MFAGQFYRPSLIPFEEVTAIANVPSRAENIGPTRTLTYCFFGFYNVLTIRGEGHALLQAHRQGPRFCCHSKCIISSSAARYIIGLY